MKLIIMTLLCFDIYSMDLSSPQMIPRMLKYKQSVLNKHSCNSDPKDSVLTTNNRESFIAKVNCSITCTDESKTTLNSTKDFIPSELSLSPGDGSNSTTTLWRSLGITLNVFKKQICFNEAQAFCGSSDIKSFNVNSIESGNWKLEQDITCKTKGVVLSPFDTTLTLKSNTKLVAFDTPASPFMDMVRPEPKNKLKEFLSSKVDALNMQNTKGCKKILKVDSCFGDCVYEKNNSDNEWVETISTPKPFGEDSQFICIDKYFSKIKNSSKSISLFKCEKLIWEYIRTAEEAGESCAAMRYNSNCSDLF